VERVDLGIEE